jgi:hypothetical protein
MAAIKRPGFGEVRSLQRPSLMSVPPVEDAPEPVAPEPPAEPEPVRLAGVRGDPAPRRPIRRDKRAITFWVSQPAQTQFKMLAVKEDRAGQDLMEEALNDLFSKYGLHRIAAK